MAPVLLELRKHLERFETKLCVTAQHREMLDAVMETFGIKPDIDLNIMHKGQSLSYITSAVLSGITEVIEREKPDYLLVQGDTTTSMAASLAAFYQHVNIAHIEAGLRTGDNDHPFPEEVNRRIIDSVSTLFFAHTEKARLNLLAEGVEERAIEVTGNTVVDALLLVAGMPSDERESVLGSIPQGKKIVLVTAHRREHFGEPLKNICAAIGEIASRYPHDVHVVFPVHPNPHVREPVFRILGGYPNVTLTAPLEYGPFIHLMKRAYLILTDSGGLQEEAASLHIPVLVLRTVTERGEGVEAGAARMVGTKPSDIVSAAVGLIEDADDYQSMTRAKNPYGDGQASRKIVERLRVEMAAHHGLSSAV